MDPITYAHVVDGVVRNLELGDENYTGTPGETYVPWAPGCQIGGTYADGVFTPAPSPPEPEAPAD